MVLMLGNYGLLRRRTLQNLSVYRLLAELVNVELTFAVTDFDKALVAVHDRALILL